MQNLFINANQSKYLIKQIVHDVFLHNLCAILTFIVVLLSYQDAENNTRVMSALENCNYSIFKMPSL